MELIGNFLKRRAVEAVCVGTGRFQIFRQTHSGIFLADWRYNLAHKAVDAFLRTTPLFEGGDIRLWDHQTCRLMAVVKWQAGKTEFGFSVQRRIDIFHDRVLASIARQIRRSQSIECSLEPKKGGA